MNKAELVNNIAKDAGITVKQADAALDSFIGSLTSALRKSGDEARLTMVGFGTFKKVRRKKREGRNPKTSETITIPARNAVVFKPGKTLKEAVQ